MSINTDSCSNFSAASVQRSQRLRALAAFVPPKSKRLIDIGCDHATVPLELLANGTIEEALLVDVKAGPLNRARSRAAKMYSEFANRIQYLQSYGLHGIVVRKTDVLLISGLGGETIAEILSNAFSDRKRSRPKKIILQPQSKQYNLRATLQSLSFHIKKEDIVLDKNRYYTVIICDNNNYENSRLSELELYIGPKLITAVKCSLKQEQLSETDKVMLEWAQAQLERLKLEKRGDDSRARLVRELTQLLEKETDD